MAKTRKARGIPKAPRTPKQLEAEKHLRPWRKGIPSPNPGGVFQGKGPRSLRELLKEGQEEAVLAKILHHATEGRSEYMASQAWKILAERLWPVIQRTELTGKDGGPLQLMAQHLRSLTDAQLDELIKLQAKALVPQLEAPQAVDAEVEG